VTRPLRIANFSGFYGDRLAAARELLDGPDPVDVLTGDYLAELTMLILWKARQRDPAAGHATTFLRQMEDILGTCVERGIRVVTNAGGLNPAGLRRALEDLAARAGIDARIASVEGDDLIDRLDALQAAGHDLRHLDTGRPLAEAGVQPLTANAYLGAWGIAEALAAGADVVVCGRVTDASLVVGPAAWWHGWRRDDWDRLAGAVVAGHILECGPQATGGNYPFLDEITAPGRPGFPIAEMDDDGSFVVTKQPGTGGVVSTGTVTAQLLYEIAEPAYANPDVVARFDTIGLSPAGDDRVLVSGVRGSPPPPTYKVALNFDGGYRNTMTMVITGLNIERKAECALELLFLNLGGRQQFEDVDVQLLRYDRPDATINAEATAHLRVTVKDHDAAKVGRRFSNAVVELSLAAYAGFFTTTPPTAESSFGIYWPAIVPAGVVEHRVVLPDGTARTIPHSAEGTAGSPAPAPAPPPPPLHAPAGPTVRAPLGRICGARSGDKGGNANVGLWARDDHAYAWLAAHLTPERLTELAPEFASCTVSRYELPNLRALNFVIGGILGEGVAASVRVDPQAKGLGEFVRSRMVDIPAALLEEGR